LKDENRGVRKRAVWTLGEIKDARAVEPLIGALKDKDLNVQIETVKALEKIGEPAVEFLIEALRDENRTVRYGAVKALGNIGSARALSPLTQALNDKDGEVRKAAKEALENIVDLES